MKSYRTPSGGVTVAEAEPGFFTIDGPAAAGVLAMVHAGVLVPGPEGAEPAAMDNVGLVVEFATGERLVEVTGT